MLFELNTNTGAFKRNYARHWENNTHALCAIRFCISQRINKPLITPKKCFVYSLGHAWATYGRRAKSGSPRLLIRPANKFSRAAGLCNISIFIYFI